MPVKKSHSIFYPSENPSILICSRKEGILDSIHHYVWDITYDHCFIAKDVYQNNLFSEDLWQVDIITIKLWTFVFIFYSTSISEYPVGKLVLLMAQYWKHNHLGVFLYFYTREVVSKSCLCFAMKFPLSLHFHIYICKSFKFAKLQSCK